MPRCEEYCLDMPDAFPCVEFTEFMAAARRILLNPTQSPLWKEFAGASNLIGWRFLASYEDWQSHKQSLLSISNPTHEDLYRMERALFGMFSSGVASVESSVYALSALASHPAVLSLPFGPNEQKACNARRLLDRLKPHPKANALSVILAGMISSQQWSLWVTLRNRMTHRSNLPRILFASIGSRPPATKPLVFSATSSTPDIDADTTDFDQLHTWLATTIRGLVVEGSNLVNVP